MQQKQERKQKKVDFGSDFAPALAPEPAFERPEAGRWEVEQRKAKPGRNASGKWADARSSFGLETEGGPGFVDPGSHALAEHSSPLMQADAVPGSAIHSASRDLGSSASFGAVGPSGGAGGGSFGGRASGGGSGSAR